MPFLAKLIAVAAFVALFADRAAASDGEGRYAVDGAGRATCATFVEAETTGEAAKVYAGWVDGYTTAFNHFNADTYDVTPWQSVELLYAKLRKFCEARPETRFVDAVNQLLQTLYDDRLTEKAEIVRVRVGEQATFLSSALIPRIRAALIDSGHLVDDQATTISKPVIAALRSFQLANSLPISGLPDQLTLNALLR